MQTPKYSKADYQMAEQLRQLPQNQLDILTRQNYGVSADGLKNILRIAHDLNTGGQLTADQARQFAHSTFGDVPQARIDMLVRDANSTHSGEANAKAFLKNLMQDRPEMAHRLAEVYQLAGSFSSGMTSHVVDEYLDTKAAREAEQDRFQGKDKLVPWSEADPSKVGSNAHNLDVRASIIASIDETKAVSGFKNASDRMAPIADALAGSDVGDVFRSRAAEESGESHAIRTDLGETLSQVYDQHVASEYAKSEGLPT